MFYIRARKLWGAAPPRETPTRQRPSSVRTLVVHHTAGGKPSASKVPAELRSIQRQHMSGSRGTPFIDIGYNVLIDRQGRVWEGRGIDVVGAHTLGHNTGTFGVSFLGNYEHDRLTVRQVAAFRMLKIKLRARGYRFTRITGHRFMPGQSTACPGKNIIARLGLR